MTKDTLGALKEEYLELIGREDVSEGLLQKYLTFAPILLPIAYPLQDIVIPKLELGSQ